MMESSEEKKKIFYMVVLVLTLITMIIGATLAYFALIASQKEEGTILYTGKLEINYIDGVYIKDPELIPLSNPNYGTMNGVYRNSFAVSSSGTLEQLITLELEVTNNEFTDNSLKYALYNNKGEFMKQGNISGIGKIVLSDNLYLEPIGTAKYTLLIWLDNTNYNQNYEMGNTIMGRINIYSKQLKY